MLSMRCLAAVSPLASMALRRTAVAATTVATQRQQQLRSFASATGDDADAEGDGNNKPMFTINKVDKLPRLERPDGAPGPPPQHDARKVRKASGRQLQSPSGLASQSRPSPSLKSGPPAKQDLATYLRKQIRRSSTDGILHSVESAKSRNDIIMYFKGLDHAVPVSSLWLRDACACPTCVTPSSGQKTFHTHDLPAFPHVEKCRVVVDEATGRTSLRVVWAPPKPKPRKDEATTATEATASTESAGATESTEPPVERHVSLYDSQELLYKLAGFNPQKGYPGFLPRRLWDKPTIEKALKPVSYADWMATDDGNNAEFYRGLRDLHELGILIVDGVPDSEVAVKEIANQIGNIQNTFYGELFDVVSKPQAENVAYSNVFLCLHQDLLYMNDPPYIQLLHCLSNDCDGGESLFSDSVRAAVEMQVAEPWYAAALANLQVRYHYERNGHYYYNKRPVLELDFMPNNVGGVINSLVKMTGWSPPFQDTLPHRVEQANGQHKYHTLKDSREDFELSFRHGTQGQRLAYWRKAAGRFSNRIEDPHAMLELKLKPGQCVLFDNRRVLHGRRQFNTSDGTRHLKGTYIDEQTFKSRVTDMIRRGHVPGQEKSEAELAARPMGQAPFGPLPPSKADRVSDEKAQVQAMMEATGRQSTWMLNAAKEGEQEGKEKEEGEQEGEEKDEA